MDGLFVIDYFALVAAPGSWVLRQPICFRRGLASSLPSHVTYCCLEENHTHNAWVRFSQILGSSFVTGRREEEEDILCTPVGRGGIVVYKVCLSLIQCKKNPTIVCSLEVIFLSLYDTGISSKGPELVCSRSFEMILQQVYELHLGDEKIFDTFTDES